MELIAMLKDLTHGISYIHSNGVIHRDIKIDNVILKHNVCKITDFGVSSVGEISQTFVGTPVYLAPEITNNRVYNDAYDKIDDLTNISQTSVGILEDGMGGQYTAVGILLAPPAQENGLDWFETDIASIDLQEKYTKVVEFCETHFGLVVHPKLIAFTNWW